MPATPSAGRGARAVPTCSDRWQDYATADPDRCASFYRSADKVGTALARWAWAIDANPRVPIGLVARLAHGLPAGARRSELKHEG